MKHEWDDEQIDAIQKSIEHWRENVDTLKKWDEKGMKIVSKSRWWFVVGLTIKRIFLGSDSCSLCQKYINDNCCEKCPLLIIGQGCNFEKSAWRKCLNARGNKEIITAAENMLRVLEGLLE